MRGTNSLLAALLGAALIVIISAGCSEEKGSAAGGGGPHPPAVRYVSNLDKVRGDSKLRTLCRIGYDLFTLPGEVLLDEPFSDLDAWKPMGDSVAKNPAEQNRGRLVVIENAPPLSACVRMKCTQGAAPGDLGGLLKIVEVKRNLPKDTSDPNLVRSDMILGVHASWKRVTVRGEWIDFMQVLTPKKDTGFLLLLFKDGAIAKVDRLMLRRATLPEAAFQFLPRDPSSPTPPLWDVEVAGETRKAFVTTSSGTLELSMGPGPERVLRFGLAFPAKTSRGHTQDLSLTVELVDDRESKRLLLEESLEYTPERWNLFKTWADRALKIPAAKGKGKIMLRCRSRGRGQGLAAWGAPTLLVPKAAGAPPNVVLISIDTLRADKLGAYGASHPEGISPFLDTIARDSVLFENAYAQAPYTLPSHVSMLSGQYPSVHGVLNLEYSIDADRTPMLAALLAKAGYVTGAFTGGLLVSRAFGFDEGFDAYSENDPCRKTNLRQVLQWIEANRSLPFFLFFHTYAVHDYAWDDPDYVLRFDPGRAERGSLWEGFAKDPKGTVLDGTLMDPGAQKQRLDNMYLAGIRLADDKLKELIKGLESAGDLDNTLLIITSDHGEELLERGNIQHGNTLYEEQTRVPLIIRPPKGALACRVPDLVEIVDVAPTVLEYLDIPRPREMQGASLLPFIRSSRTARGKSIVFSEVDFSSNLYTLRTKEWKIINNVRHRKPSLKEYELYRISSDPGETSELSEESPELEAMQERLSRFRNDLERLADSLGARKGKGSEIDPELLDALRAQGYVK